MALFPAPEQEWECRPELDFFHIALKKYFGLEISPYYYMIGYDTVRDWASVGGVLLDDREYQQGCERYYQSVLKRCD